MTQTVGQAVDKYKRRLKRLLVIPEDGVAAAHNSLITEIPVYTETYLGAIEMRALENGVSVFVSESSLWQSAVAHAGAIAAGAAQGEGMGDAVTPAEYVTGMAVPEKGSSFRLYSGGPPYVRRIEAIGSPVTDKGAGAWATAAAVAQDVIRASFARAVGGGQ